jgi:hypothetical protein
MNHTIEQLGPSLDKLAELAARQGRTSPIEVTVHGEVDHLADVERYVETGVTRVLVRPWTRSSEALDGMERFADEVLMST